MFAPLRFALAAFVLAVALPFAVHAEDGPKRLLLPKVPAPSLSGNLTGENEEQPIAVYLPPSYHQGDKRYPVVYFLPGFGESYIDYAVFKDDFDRLIAEGKSKEFIFVSIAGRNSLGGSFFVNSPVTGNWEDFVTRDVIAYVDAAYRTEADVGGRALSGFSMGGYGAVNIGLRHPDLFSVVYAQSPGLMTDAGLKDALPLWDTSFMDAYAAAFAPDPSLPAPHGKMLAESDVGTGNAVEGLWKAGYGDISGKLAAYKASGKTLKAMEVVIGSFDSYPWINDGSREFVRQANAVGLESELVEKEIGHSFTADCVETALIPFLAAHFFK
jgi:pimeloyl-ACP methyl ester carboxylesterase